MNREFLLNIALLVLINLLIKPFYIFGIDRSVQNLVPEGDYGLYFALFNFTFVFYILADFGMQYFNSRHLARHRHLLQKYLPAFLTLKGLLGLFYLTAVFLAALLSGYDRSYYALLGLLAVVQLLNSLVLFLRSNLSGIGLYRTDSLVSALDRLLLIFLCGALLWTPVWRSQFRIEWFVWAQIVSLSATALVVFLLVRSRAGKLTFRFRPALLRVIVRYSYPYALAVFLMTAYTRLDGIMLERILPNGRIEADLYASAFRLLDAANMLGFLFAGLLLPMFSSLSRRRDQLLSLFRVSFNLIWAGAVPLAAATILYRREIMVLLYENGGAYSGDILGLLMLTFVAMSSGYILSTLLTALGQLKRMNRIFFGGLIANLILNLWLIPHQQAVGAAFATLLTQVGIVAGHLWLVRRGLRLSFDLALVARLVGYAGVVVLLQIALWAWNPFGWGLRYIGGLACCLAPALAFRLLDWKHLRALIQRRPGLAEE